MPETLSLHAGWTVAGLSAALIALSVVVHFEALDRLNYAMPRLKLRPRLRILFLIVAILAVHMVEIAIFAGGLLLGVRLGDLGHIAGVVDPQFADMLYISATTYTTVGYGDLAPVGPLRLILGLEALTGFVLLTWSASFTFLEMQRYWRPR